MGSQTAGGRRLQCKAIGAGGRPEGRGNCGGTGDGGPRGYVNALPPTPALIMAGREDVENYPGGEEGAVLNGLHYGDRSPYLLEFFPPGPQA